MQSKGALKDGKREKFDSITSAIIISHSTHAQVFSFFEDINVDKVATEIGQIEPFFCYAYIKRKINNLNHVYH